MPLEMIILSIFIGIIPEAAFFTLLITKAKKIKNKRVLLFALMFMLQLSLSYFMQFSVWFHLMFIFCIWIIAKIIYGKNWHIADVFLISFGGLLLTAISFMGILIPSYTMALVTNRILLAVMIALIIIKDWLPRLYSFYVYVWNRGEGKPIKSVTVRNICVVGFNIGLVAVQFMFNYGLIKYKGG